MDFYHLQENIKSNQWIKDYMLPKKVVHTAGEHLVNKIPDAITKSNYNNIEKQEPVEEIIIPPEKKGRNI